MSAAFAPAQVVLVFPPLSATMRKSEIEWAAAAIVRTCQVHGNRWQPVTWEMTREVLKADVESKTEPMYSLVRNPFVNLDVRGLILAGFARWTDIDKGEVELTPKALEAIGAKWAKADEVTP